MNANKTQLNRSNYARLYHMRVMRNDQSSFDSVAVSGLFCTENESPTRTGRTVTGIRLGQSKDFRMPKAPRPG